MVFLLRKEWDINDFRPKRQLFPILDNLLRLDCRACGESQKKEAAT